MQDSSTTITIEYVVGSRNLIPCVDIIIVEINAMSLPTETSWSMQGRGEPRGRKKKILMYDTRILCTYMHRLTFHGSIYRSPASASSSVFLDFTFVCLCPFLSTCFTTPCRIYFDVGNLLPSLPPSEISKSMT